MTREDIGYKIPIRLNHGTEVVVYDPKLRFNKSIRWFVDPNFNGKKISAIHYIYKVGHGQNFILETDDYVRSILMNNEQYVKVKFFCFFDNERNVLWHYQEKNGIQTLIPIECLSADVKLIYISPKFIEKPIHEILEEINTHKKIDKPELVCPAVRNISDSVRQLIEHS